MKQTTIQLSHFVTLLSIILILASCGYNRIIIPAHEHPPLETHDYESINLILIGDTGLKNDTRDSIISAIQNEPDKDFVAILGDLVYPRGPKCKDGEAKGENKMLLDERLGTPFGPLKTPILLVAGNHDVTAGIFHRKRHTAREACFLDYAAQNPNLIMPAMDYTMDFGVAVFAVINSNKYNLNESTAKMVDSAFDGHLGWKILLGHHGLKIYYDKEKESAISNWLNEYNITPDLIGNGHAHLQQFGVYDGIMALTTGATAKLRDKTACDNTSMTLKDNCKEGQKWGRSKIGYAVLEINKDELSIKFKDTSGTILWGCKSERGSFDCL